MQGAYHTVIGHSTTLDLSSASTASGFPGTNGMGDDMAMNSDKLTLSLCSADASNSTSTAWPLPSSCHSSITAAVASLLVRRWSNATSVSYPSTSSACSRDASPRREKALRA